MAKEDTVKADEEFIGRLANISNNLWQKIASHTDNTSCKFLISCKECQFIRQCSLEKGSSEDGCCLNDIPIIKSTLCAQKTREDCKFRKEKK